MESFLSMSIHNVFSWPISTFLRFSQIGKPVLDSFQRKYIYVGQHVSSAEILNCCGLTCLQRVYIYAGQHAFSTEILNVWWLTHLQRGYIYSGPHAYSAHCIPGPIHSLWLKHISRPRLAGTLFTH